MKKLLFVLASLVAVCITACAVKSDGKLEASVDPTIVPWGGPDAPASQPAK